MFRNLQHMRAVCSFTLFFPFCLHSVWLPKLKKVVSKSEEKASGDDLSTLNSALVDSLSGALSAQDSPAGVSVCVCV